MAVLLASLTWGEAMAFAVPVVAVVLLAIDERGRRKFFSREDADGMAKRIDKDVDAIGRKSERNTGLFVALDDRVGDLEERIGRMEERQTQQWERVAEQMANTARTIDDVTRRLELMSAAQQEHALRLERLHRTGGD